MKQFVLIIFLCLCWNDSLFGQQTDRSTQEIDDPNELQISVGYQQGYFKDVLFSPLNYQEKGPVYSIAYRRKGARALLRTRLDASFSSLQTPVSDFLRSEYVLANLHIDYLQKLQRDNKLLEFFLGGGYQMQFNYLDWNDQNSYSFLVTHGIHLMGLASYEISERHSLQSSLSVPVFTLVVRPPYNAWSEDFGVDLQTNTFRLLTNGNWTSFNKYLAFDWVLGYRYRLLDALEAQLRYEFHYLKLKELEPVTHVQNQLHLGVVWCF